MDKMIIKCPCGGDAIYTSTTVPEDINRYELVRMEGDELYMAARIYTCQKCFATINTPFIEDLMIKGDDNN